MENDKIMVTVPLERYQQFITMEHNLELFKRAIFDSSRLGYNKKELTFSDSTLNTILKVTDPESYEKRLAELQNEVEDE